VTALLELRGVTKRFGAAVANQDVSLAIAPGTIHALVGENGAGKSTAMRIACGELAPDAGEVWIKGARLARPSPREAIDRGVGLVHQHFMLVGAMSVVENLVLGREPTRGPRLDLARAARELVALGERHGLPVDPWAEVDRLSVGEQQRVEILKVLWRGCDVLVLDEPTAVLAPAEVERLFGVLRGLVAGGDKAVVLITHKLDEVTAIADPITVMRAGRVVDTLPGATAPAAIARAMVGRDVALGGGPRGTAAPGEVRLDVRGLAVDRAHGGRALDGVDLAVRAGEIVGIAAVEGNGQRELIEAIAGLVPLAAGTIALGGRTLAGASVAARRAAGLAHVPEDRHRRGLALELSVAENLILGRHRELAPGLVLSPAKVDAHARAAIAAADVRPPDPSAPARALSGGNQQKIVIARELGRPEAKVLLAAHPTRGVDVGAIEAIHEDLIAARDRGWAVLLASAELAELAALSDRIVVLFRGRVAATLEGAALAAPDLVARLGAAMTGAGGAA
jgi:simple sugar transport system ATP-binding protein